MKRFMAQVFVLVVALCVAAGTANAQAVYTSLADGTTVNANLYNSKEDVYLNGGPQNPNGSGFPTGFYYFVVTDPSGAVELSTDNLNCRIAWVSPNGVVSGVNAGTNPGNTGCLHPEGSYNPNNLSTPVKLMPFNNTPNNGGEYKLWFWPIGEGADYKSARGTKTDNFKVRMSTPAPTYSISGMKWLDLANFGVKDVDEAGLGLWTITITANAPTVLPEGYVNTTTTVAVGDAVGTYSFTNLPAGSYTVCETQQAGYEQTFPTTNGGCHIVTITNADVTGIDFGNVTLRSISGKKWSDTNKNGIWDEGEPALAGWTISISGPTPAGYSLTRVTALDPLGYYEFANLRPGTYTICETQQNEYQQTFPTDNGGCHVVTLGTTNVTNKNFGNWERTYEISGKKFYDSKGMGNPADFLAGGLLGWTITIKQGDTVKGTDVTDAAGAYSFEMVAGTYTVCETLQTGYLQSYPNPTVNGGCHTVTVNYQATEAGKLKDFANYIKVGGTKYYDSNNNQQFDPATDAVVSRIQIGVQGCKNEACVDPEGRTAVQYVCTGTDGKWSVVLPEPVLGVKVQEYLPADSLEFGYWEKVLPATNEYSIPLGSGMSNINFLNICYKVTRNTGGYTLGFWSNRNGERIITNNNRLPAINGWPLKKADGTSATPFANYTAFRTWILGATATNMAYMLSAQFAATSLSVLNTPALGGFLIYDPESSNPEAMITVNTALSRAAALLTSCGGLSPCVVTEPGSLRTLMETYKNIFDKLNNNMYEVRERQSTPCANRSAGCPLQ